MMSYRIRRFSILIFPLLLATLVGGVAPVHAEGKGYVPMHQSHQMSGMRHGKSGGGCQMHGKRHEKGHGSRQGKANRGCQAKSRSHHLFGSHWKATLSAEQRAGLDRLHVNYAKNKAQLKAMMKGLKVQLAVLATTDTAQPEATTAKIEELLWAKREMLKTKYAYISAQRALLSPEQRVSFDMDVVHRAMRGKSGKSGHAGKH